MGAPDSTTTATRRTKTVSTWAASGRGQSHCPVPDGTDPCARANDKLNVAFLHEGKLGFAWNVAEGNGFPFPHIRMARFDLATMNLADEPDVWHPDYAWVYAAAGVGAAGHLGLSLYRIGGGSFPRARVALVDDVDTDIDSLDVHGVITSDAGTLDPTGAVIGRWGDYAAVRPYGNCEHVRGHRPLPAGREPQQGLRAPLRLVRPGARRLRRPGRQRCRVPSERPPARRVAARRADDAQHRLRDGRLVDHPRVPVARRFPLR